MPFNPEKYFEGNYLEKLGEVNATEQGGLKKNSAVSGNEKFSEHLVSNQAINIEDLKKSAEDFYTILSELIINKKSQQIYGYFSERLRGYIRTEKDYIDFFAKSEVIGHIIEMNLSLKDVSSIYAEYAGSVKTDSGKTYPAEMTFEMEEGKWKIFGMGFAPASIL